MIWTNEYLNSLLQRCDIEITSEFKCVFDVITINVLPNVAVYNLPSNTVEVIQAIFDNEVIDQISDIDYQSLMPNATGKPRFYKLIGYGMNKIELYPKPNMNGELIILAYLTGDLPNYISRPLRKYYALYRAFAKEGKGQNLTASNYFKQKFDFELAMFKTMYQNVFRSIRRPTYEVTRIPRKPLLPWRYRTV